MASPILLDFLLLRFLFEVCFYQKLWLPGAQEKKSYMFYIAVGNNCYSERIIL